MSTTPNLGLKNDYTSGDPIAASALIATANDLDAAYAAIASATITPGAEAANVIQVTVQIVNLSGNVIAEKRGIEAWLVDTNDASAALCATAPSGGWVAGVGRLLYSYTSGKHIKVVTNSSGVARLDITEVTAKTFYLVIQVGSKLTIAVVTFA